MKQWWTMIALIRSFTDNYSICDRGNPYYSSNREFFLIYDVMFPHVRVMCHLSVGPVFIKWKKTSTMPSCSGQIPTQKIQGNSVPGAVFSYTMPKWIFIIPIVSVGEKTHTIDTSHAMVISIITSHRSYRNWSNILKSYPLGSRRSWNEMCLFLLWLVEKNA